MKHSSSKNPDKKEERNSLIKKAHLLYLELAQAIVDKAKESLILLSLADIDFITRLKIKEIKGYIAHAERQIDQIRRRVINGETIPHNEKVFSIFEEHTKWIVKGKAGVPWESGLNVCIVKDQFGFILHHRVMENESDVQIAVPVITETKERFDNLTVVPLTRAFTVPLIRRNLLKSWTACFYPAKVNCRLSIGRLKTLMTSERPGVNIRR